MQGRGGGGGGKKRGGEKEMQGGFPRGDVAEEQTVAYKSPLRNYEEISKM